MDSILIIFTKIPSILAGVPYTLLLTVLSLFFGLLIGVLIMMLRISKKALCRGIGSVYLFIVRATPQLIMIFITFYLIPAILRACGVSTRNWDSIVFATAALALIASGYIAEILRSSFAAIPKGQIDAALSLGMTTPQMYIRILIPQAFKIFIPGFFNYAIMLLKDTSLASLIGVTDILFKTNNVIVSTRGLYRIENLISAAIIYWVLSNVLSLITKLFDRKSKMDKKLASLNGWAREAAR